MAFSVISSSLSLGRVLLRARAFAIPSIVSPVLLRRSFYTTPLVAEEAKIRKTKTKKKDVAAETGKAKPGKTRKNTITPKEAKEQVKVMKKHLKIPRSGRALTPWMDFNGQYVAKHKTPETTFAELVKAASQEWHSLSIEEKNKYGSTVEQRAEAREIAKKYRKTPEYKRAAKMFATKGPNRPMSAYTEFYRANFDRSSSLSAPEQAKKFGQEWNALTLNQKDYWRKVAVENFEKKLLSEQAARVEQ